VASILVLWDVDYTLIESGRLGQMLYEMVFAELFGQDLPRPETMMAGRTDSAIALEVLTAAGLPEPRQALPAFQAALAARAPELLEAAKRLGRALPGAAEALAAVARRSGPRQLIVQSLLTGNIRPLAEVKLGSLGLLDHLDLDAGAYGDAHEVRAELVPVARRSAAAAYGADFSGEATVLIGDTPLDIEAALATGARAIGVTTGRFGADQLAAAGAHYVLPSLTDTGSVLSAILAPSRA
jgi:phosphoglycolate phosphatase-like HAD superfamily hydrolase